MKVTIDLAPNETQEEADELLQKALHAKHEDSHSERYADPILNQFHSHVEGLAANLFNGLRSDLERELTNAGVEANHR